MIPLQIITGNNPRPIPYTSQMMVLKNTMNIVTILRSPTLFVFHAL